MNSDNFISRDGTTLRSYSWEPMTAQNMMAQKQIVIVHGIGEHAQRWAPHIENHFLKFDLSVYSYDLRGHGASEGERWTTPQFPKHVTDLADYLKHLDQKNKLGDHTFLFGHSLGALIAASHLAANNDAKIAGVIFSSGAFQISKDLNLFMQKAARLIHHFFPRFGLDQIPSEKISSLPEEVAKYESDPLIHHGKIDAQTAVAILDQILWLRSQMKKIVHPTLILHGKKDQVTDPDGSQYLYDNISSERKSLIYLNDSRHEVFNDVDSPRFFDKIKGFVRELN